MRRFSTITPLTALAMSGCLLTVSAYAAPGDIYEVNSDLVNLRAGPSNEASVRDRVEGGTQVIELERDGNWYGVRTLDSGLEGWIYGDLLNRISSSGLSDQRVDAGFAEYSRDFDQLIGQINDRLGLAMVNSLVADDSRLTVEPTSAWLRASSQDAHALATSAIYGMWKNYNNNAPVSVVMLDENDDAYVSIEDEGEDGPRLTVNDVAVGRE